MRCRVTDKPRVFIVYQSSLAACGVGTFVELVSSELEKAGWDVTVGLAWGAKFHDPRRVEAFRPTLKTVWMDGRSGSPEGRIRGVERAIRSVQPDVVILTLLDAAFEAVRRLRYQGSAVRLVGCNQNNFPEHAACFLQNRDVLDGVVCVGRLSAMALADQSNGFASDRVFHIPNGIRVPTAPRPSRGLANRIGYVARLGTDPIKNAKDVFPFFQALAQLHDTAELWVAGDGELADQLRQLVADHPTRVRYFGRLTQDELYKSFFPHIDIFMNFAPYEGWPQAIAEAMSHGAVPVIAEYCGVHAEQVVREDVTGKIFPVFDTDRAAEIAAELLCDPARLKRMGATASEFVCREFSSEMLGQRWDAALRRVLNLAELPPPARPESLDRRGRCHLRETHLESLRRALGRRFIHRSPGEEWPNFSCHDPRLVTTVKSVMDDREHLAASQGV